MTLLLKTWMTENGFSKATDNKRVHRWMRERSCILQKNHNQSMDWPRLWSFRVCPKRHSWTERRARWLLQWMAPLGVAKFFCQITPWRVWSLRIFVRLEQKSGLSLYKLLSWIQYSYTFKSSFSKTLGCWLSHGSHGFFLPICVGLHRCSCSIERQDNATEQKPTSMFVETHLANMF